MNAATSASRWRRLAGVLVALGSASFCSDPTDPVPGVEFLALSRDSVALQLRDSAFELIASPRGALGVELDADVVWRSKDSRILLLAPNGRTARLIPVRAGATEVEAIAGDRVATARVFVLDTVFSVQLTSSDTLVTMGQSLQFTATVLGPPGASREVTWVVTNPAVASIDPARGTNPVFIVSRDTGSTDITATSTIDRKKFATTRLRTARPVSLHFDLQPGQVTAPIRANDNLIPGPIVIARDILGNVFPGPVPVTLAITPGTGTAGAALFGTPVLTTSNAEAKFENLGVDSTGTDFRLTATSPGLTAASSSTFSVGPECPGTPFALGTVVTGTITTTSCQSAAGQYYARYIVTSATQQFFTIKVPQPFRPGFLSPTGERFGPNVDSVLVIVPQGSYSIRVFSGTSVLTGSYQMTTGTPNIPRGITGQIVCQLIQVVPGIISFTDELRCGSTAGAADTFYRLHMKANVAATVSVSSQAFEPSLRASLAIGGAALADDPRVAGRFTAQINVPPSPVARNVIINIAAPNGTPLATLFTITIQAR